MKWCWRHIITETKMSSGWLPWSSLETLKLVFNVSSDEQGSHPDDISVSVIYMMIYQIQQHSFIALTSNRNRILYRILSIDNIIANHSLFEIHNTPYRIIPCYRVDIMVCKIDTPPTKTWLTLLAAADTTLRCDYFNRSQSQNPGI